jgi:hypothetical protein
MPSSVIKTNYVVDARKDNLSAIAAPTANDDSSVGYTERSLWVYGADTYICINDTVGNAVWKKISEPKHNFAAGAAPTVNDDSGDGYSVGSMWYYSGIMYICTTPTVGAAVWVTLGSGGGGSSMVNPLDIQEFGL